MAKVDELDPLLQSLQALKPPGASKGKITAITQLCVDNVQSDSVIAQKLFSHFKRTLATHKLGVLFVVDSVTRQWIEKARQAGQELSGSAAPGGTFASGIYKMTELMPSLIDDLLKVAPQEQKVKVLNLVDIWERGNTFPAKMLAEFKLKLKNPTSQIASSTPPGSPPQQLLASLGLRQASRPQPGPHSATNGLQAAQSTTQPDAASILAALAGLSKPAQPVLPPPAPAAPKPQDFSALLSSIGQAAPPSQHYPQPLIPPQYAQQYPGPAPPQASIPPQQSGLFAPPPPPQYSVPVPAPALQPVAQNAAAAITAALPPHILSNPESLAQVLKIFQDLTQAGVPQAQWAPVLAALYPQTQPAPAASAPSWQAQPQNGYQSGAGAQASPYGGPQDQSRRRDRSRSPDYRHDRNAGGARRGSPVYGSYDELAAANSSQNDAGRGRRQGGRNFRQRTPPGVRTGQLDAPAPPGSIRPKWADIDPTIPQGHIKVLSRTLFVGGATGSESDLRAIFGRFGQVQTCIVNHDKRHAFVKMSTRQDAVAARSGMENLRDPDLLAKARQTKWGVGFGPRECCDYSTGVSIIPIDTLTEADHKWVLTAEYGGTGGRPIESGLVIEEPDIEIGAGVSSKAMSRRVMPDTGGKRGRGGRDGGGGGDRGRFRQPEHRRESPRPEPVNVQPPPPVPNFGFQFAMPGNMPSY